MSEDKSADAEGKSGSPLPSSDSATQTPPSQTSDKQSEGKDTKSPKQSEGQDDAINPVALTTDTYTIDDAVDRAGYGRFQKLLTFLAGMGWIVFIGMAVGAPTFGNFADRYGRRTCLGISMLLLFIFGAASAAAPNYVWIIILRGLMGFSLGGIAQGVTLCCEYYPAQMRGRAGFYLSYYWALGTLGVIAVAWVIMAHLDNWRIFVFLASVPALLVFLSMLWYPESARFYLVSSQSKKAVQTLKRMAKMNKTELPKGRLIEMDATAEKGRIQDLLKPEMRRTTLLFWYMWLASAFSYYGIALLTPIIIKNGSLFRATSNQTKSISEDFREVMPCVKFSNQNFFDLLWTSAAEFPGLLIFTFVVECCSRRVFLGTTFLILAFLILLLMLEVKPEFGIFVILFISRGLVAGVFQLLFIMTSEAFPTTLRASAMGTGSGWARVGGAIIPFLAQVTVLAQPVISMFVLGGVSALSGIAAFMLPVDTRGMHMSEVVTKV